MLRFYAALLLCLGVCWQPATCAVDAPDAKAAVAENQNQSSAGQPGNGVLTLHLVLQRGVWHPRAANERGIEVATLAEEGRAPQAPGPMIRAPQGTEIHASIH